MNEDINLNSDQPTLKNLKNLESFQNLGNLDDDDLLNLLNDYDVNSSDDETNKMK